MLAELKLIKSAVRDCESSLMAKLVELSGILSTANGSATFGNSPVLMDAPRDETVALKGENTNANEINELRNRLAQNDSYIRKLVDGHSAKETQLNETIEKLRGDLSNSEELLKYHEEKSGKYDELAGSLASQGIRLPERQARHVYTCENIHIGFFGSEARAGVTNTALAFSKWLVDSGGSCAYVEENLHNHCATFNADTSAMHSVVTGYGYAWEGVDIHLRTIKHAAPLLDLGKGYNFIVHDFGRLPDYTGADVPDVGDILEKMDAVVLVGCFKGYERGSSIDALRILKHLDNLVFALNFTHESYHRQLAGHFLPSMEGSISFIDYMPDPEFPLSNQGLFETIIKKYI